MDLVGVEGVLVKAGRVGKQEKKISTGSSFEGAALSNRVTLTVIIVPEVVVCLLKSHLCLDPRIVSNFVKASPISAPEAATRRLDTMTEVTARCFIADGGDRGI